MSGAEQYSYARYLRSKRTVDDRALNRAVMDAALGALDTSRCLEVAELGGGVGTMVDRLMADGRISSANYVLVDAEAEFVEEVEALVPTWREGTTRMGPTDARFRVSSHRERIEDWSKKDDEVYDLIIAHAVLDLVDIPTVLPSLLARLAPGGVFWTTINFDGETIFIPRVDGEARLMEAYHRSMDERETGAGSSTTGRELFGHIPAAGGRVLRAGSSDWVVHGTPGGYEADEAYFLHHIVHTVENELGPHPELGAQVRDWGRQRHAQVERGELVYIAHQLDFAVVRAGAE